MKKPGIGKKWYLFICHRVQIEKVETALSHIWGFKCNERIKLNGELYQISVIDKQDVDKIVRIHVNVVSPRHNINRKGKTQCEALTAAYNARCLNSCDPLAHSTLCSTHYRVDQKSKVKRCYTQGSEAVHTIIDELVQ